jgi:argininosuccinate lyase
LAEGLGRPLDQLTREDFRKIDVRFGSDVTGVFTLSRALARRTSTGAPGTAQVRKQLGRWKKAFATGPHREARRVTKVRGKRT